MTIQVIGKLTDSGGYDAPNTEIKLVTTQGVGSTLRTAELVVRTGNDASYDFDIAIGKHVIYVKYVNKFELIGSLIVNSDTPSPLSISDLLKLTEPLTPDEVILVSQLVAEARSAASEALQSEQNAAASEQEVEAGRQEVAQNTAVTTQNTVTTQNNADQVAQDKIDITSMRDEVENDRVEVATNTNQVSLDATQVAQDKLEVANNTQTVATNTQTVSDKAQQVSDDAVQVAADKQSVEQTAADVATAQVIIGTSIDGVYANAAGIVSINDTILRLHPIYEAEE